MARSIKIYDQTIAISGMSTATYLSIRNLVFSIEFPCNTSHLVANSNSKNH